MQRSLTLLSPKKPIADISLFQIADRITTPKYTNCTFAFLIYDIQ